MLPLAEPTGRRPKAESTLGAREPPDNLVPGIAGGSGARPRSNGDGNSAEAASSSALGPAPRRTEERASSERATAAEASAAPGVEVSLSNMALANTNKSSERPALGRTDPRHGEPRPRHRGSSPAPSSGPGGGGAGARCGAAGAAAGAAALLDDELLWDSALKLRAKCPSCTLGGSGTSLETSGAQEAALDEAGDAQHPTTWCTSSGAQAPREGFRNCAPLARCGRDEPDPQRRLGPGSIFADAAS
mmetsp:Transcript_72927/g.237037  ORF Transcript_72927/g.237037 Transcript_72927/m.237037 type:complete len:246 (-) Transcript_72927:1504-2241(-)